MVIANYFLLASYVIALMSLFACGANCYFLVLYHGLKCSRALRRRELVAEKTFAKGGAHVTIQLPLFNKRYVVERLIKSACQIEYGTLFDC
jgi:hypothetical protein